MFRKALEELSYSAWLQINSQKKRTGVIAPKRFVQRLKRDNELFRSYMHQVSSTEEPPLTSMHVSAS